jgi:hypothetical protein
MMSPRVEVLCALPRIFTLEKVRCSVPEHWPVRLERWNDARGFPCRWRLWVGYRDVLDCKVPVTFNGEDPFEVLANRVGSLATMPGAVCTLDLAHELGAFR